MGLLEHEQGYMQKKIVCKVVLMVWYEFFPYQCAKVHNMCSIIKYTVLFLFKTMSKKKGI